jgi:hypothetical protein
MDAELNANKLTRVEKGQVLIAGEVACKRYRVHLANDEKRKNEHSESQLSFPHSISKNKKMQTHPDHH